MNRLSKEVFDRIKSAVEKEAKHRGVSGFMIVADLVTGVAMFSLIHREDVVVTDREGGYNIASIAGSKFGKVFAYRKDSGGKSDIIGEFNWQGGRISVDGEFIYAFSGAEQTVDYEMMVIAEGAHQAFDVIHELCCPECHSTKMTFKGSRATCSTCGWNGVNPDWPGSEWMNGERPVWGRIIGTTRSVKNVDYIGLVKQVAAVGRDNMMGVVIEQLDALGLAPTAAEARYFWASLFNTAKNNLVVWQWLQDHMLLQGIMQLKPEYRDNPEEAPDFELPAI